jgi:hypothetical protein
VSHRNETTLVIGLLVAALSVVPGARGQSQTQEAQTSSRDSASTKTQAQGDAASSSASTASNPAKTQNSSSPPSSGNEPQMQSQEAPPPESLGEAARKARAQKAAAPAAKVYTEDKVARLSGHGVSVVGDGSKSGDSSDAENADGEPSASGASKGNAPSGNSDEKVWREKARAIHDQLAQIDDRISKIQDEIQKYGAVSFDPSTGLRQNVIYVEDRNAQIKQLEEQKSKLQSQLDSLEEEGRKAGADSGWFR